MERERRGSVNDEEDEVMCKNMIRISIFNLTSMDIDIFGDTSKGFGRISSFEFIKKCLLYSGILRSATTGYLHYSFFNR